MTLLRKLTKISDAENTAHIMGFVSFLITNYTIQLSNIIVNSPIKIAVNGSSQSLKKLGLKVYVCR